MQAAAVGLGAGLAASANRGRVVRRSYETALQAEQAAMAQTKAIEQYMKLGAKFEAAKQWDYAEKAYKYVLQVVAKRDGPGSVKSVPALEHLVAVKKAQNHVDEAIDFQETVLRFTKSAKIPSAPAVANAQINLGNLYLMKEDYASAEPLLRESVAYYDAHPALHANRRKAVLKSFGQTLRKLHKDAEADSVDAKADAIGDGDQTAANTIAAETKTPATVVKQGTGDSAGTSAESITSNTASSSTSIATPPVPAANSIEGNSDKQPPVSTQAP